jgi:hypothetical protein
LVPVLLKVLLSGVSHPGDRAVLGAMLVEVVRDVADHIVKNALRRLNGCETSRGPASSNLWGRSFFRGYELQQTLSAFHIV